MKSVEGQRYSNEHLAAKLKIVKDKFEKQLANAHPQDRFKLKKELLVAQIIWMREGELIRNDIYRDFRLL